jgi:hypothetical protein
MQPADYQKALDAARAEIQEVLAQRTQLDERLNQLKKIVDAISALLEPAPETPGYGEILNEWTDMGISNAIRQILSESSGPMSPVGIRDELIKRGFSLTEYANPLAVIHNTLKRLLMQEEILGVRDRTQQIVAYARRTVPPPPSIDAMYNVGTATDSPENQAVRHPAYKMKAPKPPLTPGEAKRMMESVLPKK